MRKPRKFAIVHGKHGYYRRGFIAHRGGKSYRVRRTYVPPTRKIFKMRIWKLGR